MDTASATFDYALGFPYATAEFTGEGASAASGNFGLPSWALALVYSVRGQTGVPRSNVETQVRNVEIAGKLTREDLALLWNRLADEREKFERELESDEDF
jgi:hypothetical protein